MSAEKKARNESSCKGHKTEDRRLDLTRCDSLQALDSLQARVPPAPFRCFEREDLFSDQAKPVFSSRHELFMSEKSLMGVLC